MNKLKLLLATDYSAASLNAGCYALEMVKKREAELILTHAYVMSMGSIPVDAKEFAKATAQVKSRELRTLEQQKNELLHECNISEQDIDVICIIHETSVGACIQEEIKNQKPDLIVAGSHGHGMNRKKLFGNNAWDIIKHSTVPVLLIPPNAKFKHIKSIVVAVEGHENEINSINSITRIANLFSAKVTVLHISNTVPARENEFTAFDAFKKYLISNVLYNKLSVQMIEHENLLDGLNNFCEQENADWLVMLPKKHSFIDSILNPTGFTKKMSSKTHLPLLSIPEHMILEEQSVLNTDSHYPNQ